MTTNRMFRILPALAAAGLLLGGAAQAQTAAATGPAGAAWQPAQIIEHLQQAGYRDVRDVDWDDGAWELEATSPAGKRVDVRVDPATGKTLHEELD